MSILDDINKQLAPRARSYLLGEGVSTPIYPLSDKKFSPSEYGNYIATSNGVYVCSNLRADLLSSSPLKTLKRMKVKDEIKGIEQTSGDLYDLLNKVNPFWTLNRLLYMTELSLSLWGKAFWFVERGASGKGAPQEIWWARPDRVKVIPHPTKYIDHFEYDPGAGKPLEFSPAETVWLRYPNPIDEYEGLSPLAAARIAADISTSAMKSNKNFFDQGMLLGGVIKPPEGVAWSPKQSDELEENMERRFAGKDRHHRWMVMRQSVGVEKVDMSMKDAEFIATLKWSLDDIARAYKIPPDLIGGQAIYSNAHEAERAVWNRAIKPEARFLQTELTEQLVPMFGLQKDTYVEFDFSGVAVLNEAENDKWTRASGQIASGVITINEQREELGLKKMPWGDTWWKQFSLADVAMDAKPDDEPADDQVDEEDDDDAERGVRSYSPIVYGDERHQFHWQRHIRRASKYETKLSDRVIALLERQRASVLAKLKARSARTPSEAELNPFSLAEWTKTFRESVRPVISFIVSDAGQAAMEDLGVSAAFDLSNPQFIRFMERRTQRFAELVNEATWNELKSSLAEGMAAGEAVPSLADRVEQIMAERIRSTPEVIARTEVNGSVNGGTLIGWKQSEVVSKKSWLGTLDDRTRETHIEAHNRYQQEPIDLDEDFIVGAGAGDAPGQIGLPEEDIQCRCSMMPVIDERTYFQKVGRSPIGAVHLPFIMQKDRKMTEKYLKRLLDKLEVVPHVD